MAFLQIQNGDHLCQWKKLWKSLTMLHLLCTHQQYLWRMPNSFHRSTTLLKGFDQECFVGKEKVPKLHHNGVPVRVNGKQQMEERVNI